MKKIIPAVSISQDVKFPALALVKREFDAPVINNVQDKVIEELETIKGQINIKKGSKIAVAVGSRGIANLSLIIKTLITGLIDLGAEPFIVPAMGSHGGANAEGQKKILKTYGITEKRMGVPIRATMDTVKLGETSDGIPVFFDKIAAEADGIIPVNRVKNHTDFIGKTESGLLKMLVIGLGKEKGASYIHQSGPPNYPIIIPEAAEIIIKKTAVLFGIAVVENGYHQTARIKAVPAKLFREKEGQLLSYAKSITPKVPVDADVLVVDEIGKEISGCGMDTMVIGRIRIRNVPEPEKPEIFRVVVLDVTAESKGNVSGLGIADYTTKRLVDKIDFQALYKNEIASASSERGKIPIGLATDRDAIAAALLSCWMVPTDKSRLVRIKNTMVLDQFYVSEALIEEVKKLPGIISISPVRKMKFINGSVEGFGK